MSCALQHSAFAVATDGAVSTERFHTFILDGIPRMGREQRNEAMRFIALIDVLYDNRVGLICSADAPPEALYEGPDGAFEFERTASRLIEMRSAEYLAHVRG